jgi:L-ascorbate oxidase
MKSFMLLAIAPIATIINAQLYGPDVNVTLSWGYDNTPDCVKRQPLVLVNGVWPPPTIHVKAGDQITLRARNELIAVAFTIHLHGFDQVGTPWADGTGMISTCPNIPSTASSVQVFKAPDLPGTYIYHGHVAYTKASGFTGLLLVEPNPALGITYQATYAHDETLDLLIADTYHGPAMPILSGLLQQNFRWAGDPQGVLLNGLGYFNCEENVIYTCEDFGNSLCTTGVSTSKVCGAANAVYYNNLVHCEASLCPMRASLLVKTGKTYLLRVANGSILSLLNLVIQGHTLTVVELDGIPVTPKTVSSLDLSAGQRAAVLLTADQPSGVYWIDAGIRGRSGVRYGSGFLQYDGKSSPNLEGAEGENDETLKTVRASHPDTGDYNFTRAQQQGYESPFPEAMPSLADVDRTFIFLNTQERFLEGTVDHTPSSSDASGIGIGDKLEEQPQCFCSQSDGYLKWAVNRRTFTKPQTPLLHKMFYGLEKRSPEELERENFYMLEEGKTYDIVLQNYPACNGVCETHPWHMHGHHFWHVGTWEGGYDPKVGYPTSGGGGNFIRDTITLVGDSPKQNMTPSNGAKCSSTLKPCGFTVIRFVANNPGAWFFHCHIDWHLVMGMAVAFYYKDIPETAPPPDLSITEICGEVYPSVVLKQQAATITAVPTPAPTQKGVGGGGGGGGKNGKKKKSEGTVRG